jgi:uncharacterized RDD family membrane protein YckC
VTATEGRPQPVEYPWRQVPAPRPPAEPAPDPRGARAGLVSRVVASTVDGVVVAVLVAAGWAVVIAFAFLLHPVRFRLPSPGGQVLLYVGLGVLAAYLAVGWAVAGGSFGDRLLGLRVVDARGAKLHWGRAVLRAVLCTVFPLGLFWVLVSAGNRSVQDLLVRTSVVHDG